MGFKLLVFFILIFPEGLNALTLRASANPVPQGSNVTISVIDSTVISFGAWLFGPSVLFLWSPTVTFNGSAYTSGMTFNSVSYALTLNSVNLSSTGLYVLEVMGSNQGRGQMYLEVQEPVSGVSASVSKTNLVEFNDSVTFTCSGRGTPMWVSWQNGSSLVTAWDRITLSNNGQLLTINPVMRYDQGPFTCILANNISRVESTQMNLNISYGPSNLILTVSPQIIAYASGSVITLSCSVDSNPAASIYWTFNDVSLNVVGPTLVLTSTTMSKSGQYACIASNAATLRYATMTQSIRIIDSITAVTVNPQSGYPIESLSFSLTCNIVGSMGSIMWMKNNVYLVADSRISFSNQNATLRFTQLNISDNGQYKCVATNDVSNMNSQDYNLMVNYGPRNVAISGPTVAALGSSVTMNCSADSCPQSQYSWYFKGLRVSQGSVYTTGGLLTNNTGQYTCSAMNNITGQSSNASVQLTVIVPVSSITVNVNNQQPIFNQSFTLTCNVIGDVSSIQWMKDGVILSPNNRTTFSNNNLTLTINPLALRDCGLYQCAASNPVSNMTSVAYNLTVNYGPWNTIISGPTAGAVGSSVTYSCSANCQPTCQYSWYFRGLKIADGSVNIMNTLSVNNGGQYTCMAYNNITRISSNATVDLAVFNTISSVGSNANNQQQPIFNQSFTLTCNVNGDVTSTQWMKDGVILSPNNRTTFSNNNLTLTINPLALSDCGSYQCVARNPVSNLTSVANNVTVNYGPWNTIISGPTAGAVGSSVNYSCSANSQPTCQYSWYFRGLKIADGSFNIMSPLAVNNGGQYTCMAYNNITRISSNATVDLAVFNIISAVTVNINNQQPIFNQSFTLTCNVNGDVTSTQWMKNGVILSPNNRITFSNNNLTLTINPLNLSDEGQYQCSPQNPVSNMASGAYNLLINYGPWNTTITGPTMGETGTNVTISCSASSRPESQYTWYFNGSQVGNSSVYVIQDVRLNNTGQYTCSAFNSITGNRSSATLGFTVYVAISAVRVSSTPSIPEASENLQLMCQVTGPYNSIYWLRNNQTLQSSDRITFTNSNSTLNFMPLQTVDNGDYQCVATNVFRGYRSQTYQLVASFGPVNVQIIVKPGYIATLTCRAESQPPAVYQWIIDHNNTVVASQATIQVSIQDILGYNYTCVARNPLTNLTIYTSHFISDSNAGVSVHSGIMLTTLLVLLLPVLNEWM